MSVVEPEKAFGNNVNRAMYLHHWIVQALKALAAHWFWARPNLNETVKLILLWQFLPTFSGLPEVKPLPDAMKKTFIELARRAGDYPGETEDYQRGEKISRNAYIPVELSRAIRATAESAECSMSHAINAALRSYLLSGCVPGNSAHFNELRSHRPSLEMVLSGAVGCWSVKAGHHALLDNGVRPIDPLSVPLPPLSVNNSSSVRLIGATPVKSPRHTTLLSATSLPESFDSSTTQSSTPSEK